VRRVGWTYPALADQSEVHVPPAVVNELAQQVSAVSVHRDRQRLVQQGRRHRQAALRAAHDDQPTSGCVVQVAGQPVQGVPVRHRQTFPRNTSVSLPAASADLT